MARYTGPKTKISRILESQSSEMANGWVKTATLQVNTAQHVSVRA